MPDLKQISEAALSSFETLTTTYDLAKLAIERRIPGDFVECGVYGGSQCAAMAVALMHDRDRRRLADPAADYQKRVHLFDCFCGLPEPGPKDIEFLQQGNMKGKASCSLEAVQDHMRRWGIDPFLLVYHPGLFKDTIPPIVSTAALGSPLLRQIAILRIDADLYESTIIPFRYLYRLVSRGGWVIVDDYALKGCRDAVHEFMLGAGGPNFQPMYWQKI